MAGTVHFISGLPRSGSTLLAAILRQNPRFHAAMTSPVALLFAALQHKMSGATEFSLFFDDERRAAILKNVFKAYYERLPPDGVIFDTNRTWAARASLLAGLYPDCRIICCVRDVGWIMDPAPIWRIRRIEFSNRPQSDGLQRNASARWMATPREATSFRLDKSMLLAASDVLHAMCFRYQSSPDGRKYAGAMHVTPPPPVTGRLSMIRPSSNFLDQRQVVCGGDRPHRVAGSGLWRRP
ncbi:MAG: sulfotransferase [Proteobacteria bacterium]|nr:sulfotransferase [Pseudomonadota bacterium]